MRIGLVIADDKEFSPVEKKCLELGGKETTVLSDKAVCFSLPNKNEFIAVLCGTGKVNATIATIALILEYKVDCIINFGLSGAISGVHKNDVVIGTKFLEHDFDLTPLGYELSIKPQEVSHYIPNEDLFNIFVSKFNFIKPCVFVTGDRFVSSGKLKEFLISNFNAGCCDMESAAVAAACYKADVPFLSLRALSDDADESAVDTYTENNLLEKDTLINMVIEVFG